MGTYVHHVRTLTAVKAAKMARSAHSPPEYFLCCCVRVDFKFYSKVTKYVKIFSGCLDQSGMGEILLTQFLAEQILARSCMEEGVEFACSTIPLQRDKCR